MALFRKKTKEDKMEEVKKIKEAVEAPAPPEEPRGYFIASIPTETQPIIAHGERDEQYEVISAIAKIMNDLEEIKEMIKEASK